MLRKAIIVSIFGCVMLLCGCMEESDETIVLPVINRCIPHHVISAGLLDTIKEYMPIYEGATPPEVGGEYYVAPLKLVYSTDVFEGEFHDLRWSADSLDGWNRTRFTEHQGNADGIGREAYVIGSGDNFTLFTLEESTDTVAGWQCRMITLVSGTMVATGVSNLHYAILLLDKQDDNGILIAPDDYRIFADGDGISNFVTK